MKFLAKSATLLLGLSFTALAQTACSDATMEADGGELTGTELEDFSTSACARVGEDAALLGQGSLIISPRTYDNCGKSFVVDVLNSQAKSVSVLWYDSLPTTRAGCADMELHSKLYVPVNDGWSLSQEVIGRTGTWTGAACVPPFLAFSNISSPNFRLATTARIVSGTNPTRKFALTVLQ
jgi:hypothetical protein